MLIQQIRTDTALGRAAAVKTAVNTALSEGVAPNEILQSGLLAAMNDVGEKFKRGEAYVPNMLVAARAMTEGLELLRPYLADNSAPKRGTAVIGTVKGDRHDIGKKLVSIMLQGKGFEVIDLGVDVPAQKFVDTAASSGARIICCSALLTTTVGEMQKVVELVNSRGFEKKVYVMIGGAAVTQDYCNAIGADCYTSDAAACADKAAELIG